MKKLSPSEKIRNEIAEGLREGIESESETSKGLLSWLIEKSVERVLQEILEQEVTDYLGRGRYQRKSSEGGYRNGYEPKRIKTAEGAYEVKMPQVRGINPFHSEVVPQGPVLSDKLKSLVTEMYVRGMSTRDIEDALKQEDGKLLLSREGVSEISETLSEELEKFSQRDLSELDVVYLFLDGVYEKCRYEAGRAEAILCAWGILSNGRKTLIHLGMGNKESYECWRDFLREMVRRGLRQPLLGTTDGAPGLIKAFAECFPGTKRQRCLFHKLQNITNKLSERGQREVLPQLKAVFEQTNVEIAMLSIQHLVEEYAEEYPAAIKCLQEDLEASLAFMDFPVGHHKAIRTTNLIERAFEEHRRRSKVIPRFMSEKSCLKLIFGTLIRVSERWRKVKMTEYDLVLLKNLRSLYGWEKEEGYLSRRVV